MFNRSFRTGSVGLLTALVVACDRAPTAPSTVQSSRIAARSGAASGLASNRGGVWREVIEDLYEWDGTVASFPCGDGFTEEILMRGKLYWRATVMEDAALGLHTTLHTMPIDMGGFGLTTGAEYRVAMGEQSVFNTGMGEAGYYQHTLRVSAPELQLQIRLVIGGRFTTNANGEVVVERPILRSECRS